MCIGLVFSAKILILYKIVFVPINSVCPHLYGGTKLINNISLYSVLSIFVFVKICFTLENSYETNIKKILY